MKSRQPERILPSMILEANQNLCLERVLFGLLSSTLGSSHSAVTGHTSVVHLLCPRLAPNTCCYFS